jgi:hypothetical protein
MKKMKSLLATTAVTLLSSGAMAYNNTTTLCGITMPASHADFVREGFTVQEIVGMASGDPEVTKVRICRLEEQPNKLGSTSVVVAYEHGTKGNWAMIVR